MKNLGLKKLLLFSIILLVGSSVSISSYILYLQQKDTLTENIMRESNNYVAAKAANIETLINEKVGGINKLADLYKTNKIEGTEQEIIAQTKFLASAMNLNSAVLAFETGDAYWSISTPRWPNHKYDTDVTTASWYQDGRKGNDVTVTNPYIGSDGGYYITIIEKIMGGTISVDMTLDFLNKMVKESNDIPGSIAVILNHDTTILASSSKIVKLGEKATKFPWFKNAVQEAVSKESHVVDYSVDGQDKIFFSHIINAGDKNWYFAIGLDKEVAFAKLKESRNVAIFITLIATLVSVMIAFMLIQILYRPILALKDTVLGLSNGDGDLTQRLQVETNDDLGQIAQGVNQFIENLQNMMLEIQNASTTLQSNINRMREHSQRNSTIIQNHVGETEQVVTAIEEMNSTAESMAKDAANTANLTQQANETSKESREKVHKSQVTVSALVGDVNKTTDDIAKMTEVTQSINGILSVIGEIAGQTNLLALNAAIEAARAGEQGRGFAVVADEVRNLASRTMSSTEEVESALERLLTGTQVVVDSMGNTKARCQETAVDTSNVEASLDIMTQYVNDINDLSTQIATAAEEQSCVTQELSRNMSAINEIVLELDANGQQALTEADDINIINNQLADIVGRFKL
ncbi:methyl-accepting chemotaxis protein [Shewanella phaeophyticola]|uniref:Methyl-accepting chemotaxis protein n=1 Tax=Shewanella phaeophyticola TaxID=2978345 RepID=A0ABT2NYU3_9GAMM|nr:methyl-accepting chemotaxis protein [Shewanella sp. KJ10-1]MCT8985569.1 methyl-accepting chemotaxis protein [Shewanella sp. KJ10-1]